MCIGQRGLYTILDGPANVFKPLFSLHDLKHYLWDRRLRGRVCEGSRSRFASPGAAIPGGGRRVGPGQAETAVTASGQRRAKCGKASEKEASISRQKPAPRTDSYFSGDLLRVSLSPCVLFAHTRPARGGEEMGKTRPAKAEPGREPGRRRARRPCSPRVKPSLDHTALSPQTLVSFVRSPPRRLQ